MLEPMEAIEDVVVPEVKVERRELVLCPFCRGDKARPIESRSPPGFRVECPSCGTLGPIAGRSVLEREAIRLWNARS